MNQKRVLHLISTDWIVTCKVHVIDNGISSIVVC